MNKLISFFLFFLAFYSTDLLASHFTGGNLRIIQQRGYEYKIIFNMYVDVEHANPGVIEAETSANLGIFEKGTNKPMEQLSLPRTSMGSNSNSCLADYRTSYITFSGAVYLDPSKYIAGEGYYIVYEGCCLNGRVLNVQYPLEEGYAIYLEFPPVKKDGMPFINSSPDIPLRRDDFACLDSDYLLDLKATDTDGDSLAYSLITPLAGHALPDVLSPPMAAPYDSIQWMTGYGRSLMIEGTLPLNIDSKGNLTMNANKKGVFLYGIKIEEYRNKKRIGLSVLQNQLLVIKCTYPVCIPEVTGLESNERISTFIGPNPFQNEIRVSLKSGVISSARVELMNMWGETVKTMIFNAAVSDVVIDGSDIPSGIYFCSISSGDFYQIKKLIKQ